MKLRSKMLKKMKEFICRIIEKSDDDSYDDSYDDYQDETDNTDTTAEKSDFGTFKIWVYVMIVYLIIFGYIGYIAFWPMAFNDPDQNIDKYFEIMDKHRDRIPEGREEELFTATINELVKKAEAGANDIQQLASQSFNIVLGAFLAFLSATVTTIFQRKRQ